MKRWDIIAAAGMLLPPSLVIGFYMYIGIFNRRLSDDYCTEYIAKRLGLLRSVWHWYKIWHGDFSANVADWLLSLFGPKALPFYTPILLFLWVMFAVIAIQEILHSKGYSTSNLFPAFLLGIFLVFTTLIMSPDVSQSVFWWQGTRSYLFPLIFAMLYFALGYHFIPLSLNRVQSIAWLFVSFGLAFFVGGFNETFTPVLIVFLAGMVGFSWLSSKSGKDKDRSILFLGMGFLGALSSFIVMALAPGNSIRQAYFPASPGIFTILEVALAGYLAFLSDTFSSLSILTGLLGTVLGSVWLSMRIQRESRVVTPPGWWVSTILFAGFILAFGCFIPAAYATSEPPAGRSLITPAFILVLCFMASGFIFGEWLAGRHKEMTVFSHASLVIGCSLIIFCSYRSFQNLYSMRDEHVLFAQKWDQVDAQIREAKRSGLQQVNIPPMENWAGTDYPGDSPKNWVNRCYSNLYGINIVAPPRD